MPFKLRSTRIPLHGRPARSDIGLGLVAMVRNIEAPLGGAKRRNQKEQSQKAESRRKVGTCGRGDQVAFIVVTGEQVRAVIPARVMWGRRDDAGKQLAQGQDPLLAVRDVSVVLVGIIALNGVPLTCTGPESLGLIDRNGAG